MKNRLVYCTNGAKIKIVDLDAGHGAAINLKNIGIEIGNDIEIIKNDLTVGPIFINKGEEILEIGRELASKIIVESDKDFEIQLDKIKIGDTVEILKTKARGEIRRRLMDMGLVKGSVLKIIRKAPLGDPIELSVNRFNLSLRLTEAENILVKVVSLGHNKNGKNRNGLK